MILLYGSREQQHDVKYKGSTFGHRLEFFPDKNAPELLLAQAFACALPFNLSAFCQPNNAIILCISFGTALNPLLWLKYKATYNRILMNIPNYFIIHFLIHNFYRLVMLLPELPIFVITVPFLPPLYIIHMIHSRLLSCPCSFISCFNRVEV